MIPAKHTLIGTWFFSLYARFQLRKHFRTIQFSGEVQDHQLPILLIGNHFTWWDGFIQLYLNDLYFKKKFHVMMLEEQLLKYKILNKAGAFSVNKGNRNILKSLDYSSKILDDPKNLLLFFPQGEIQSIYTHKFIFERGIEILLNKLRNPVTLLFNVNLVDYFSHKKPGLTIYFKEYTFVAPITLERLETAYNEYAHECMNNQKEI